MYTVFIFTWFVCFGTSFAAVLWRYYPVAGNEFGYFTTKTKFFLEYTGSEEWHLMSWYHHNDCKVANKSLSLTIARCSTAGNHQFGILRQPDKLTEIQSILVTKSPYCYKWQLKSLPTNSTSVEYNLKFKVWIDEINEVQANITNASNFSPSEFSRHITQLFHEFGVRPLLSAFLGHSKDEEEIVRQKISFAENDSLWEVETKITNLELIKLKIDGPPITFLDCFIKPMTFEIQHNKYNFLWATSQVSLEQDVNQMKFVQDHCFPNVIAAVINDRLVLTQDYFQTLSLLDETFIKSMSSVDHVIFSRGGNLLMYTDEKTFVMAKDSSDIYLLQGLPSGRLHFSSYSWCHQDTLLHKTFTDVVLAWSNQSSLYISLDPSLGFTRLSLPDYFESKNFSFLDAKVNGICFCVYFLIELSSNYSKMIVYTTYKYNEDAWGKVNILLNETQYPTNNESSWHFQFLPPDTFSFLLWNSWDVFYKSAEGESIKVITKQSNFSTSNIIVDITTSNNGEYLVLYDSNDLYYGRIGMDTMVQVKFGFQVQTGVRMVFDLNGHVHAVTVNKSNSAIMAKNYPLDNEIFSAVHLRINCPFVEFSFGSPSLTKIVDKWGQFQIWGYLVYKRSKPNDIKLVWNPTKLLGVTVSEHKEFYQDTIMLNKTFTFFEQVSGNISFTNSTSSFSATLIPKVNGMTCKRPFHKVFHFHMGCPPARKAIIRDARFSQNVSLHDKQSSFPFKLLPDEAFRFFLFLYDENVLIKQVNTQFELAEINGRTEYTVVNQSDHAVISFQGSGVFEFLLAFHDKNTSFCHSTVEFTLSVDKVVKASYTYIEFACVTVVTIFFINFLAVDYLRFRKSFLQRHGDDDDTRSRLQELQYLAQLQYFRGGATVEVPPTPEQEISEENRRRVAVIAKSERRGSRRSSVFGRVSKGVFHDFKVQQRSATPSVSLQAVHEEENGNEPPPNKEIGD